MILKKPVSPDVRIGKNLGEWGIENDDFTTQLEFYKQDSSSQEGISGAVFKLYYSETPFVTTVQDGENKGDILTNRYQNSFVQEVASDSNGKVSMNLTKKGHYLLIETSNTGYQKTIKGNKE